MSTSYDFDFYKTYENYDLIFYILENSMSMVDDMDVKVWLLFNFKGY